MLRDIAKPTPIPTLVGVQGYHGEGMERVGLEPKWLRLILVGMFRHAENATQTQAQKSAGRR
eukprot:15170572-Heterocapsa_arctica.AAC.1